MTRERVGALVDFLSLSFLGELRRRLDLVVGELSGRVRFGGGDIATISGDEGSATGMLSAATRHLHVAVVDSMQLTGLCYFT